MSPSKAETKQALDAMKCPRCGARLHYRDVLSEDGGAISREFGEIYDIYGHSFSIHIKDFIAREGKAA
jgi:hypothetical protein